GMGVVELVAAGGEQVEVAPGDDLGGFWREQVLGSLSQNLVAHPSQLLLGGTIHENTLPVVGALYGDRRRDVFKDGVEELAGAADLVLGALAVGNVDQSHDRSRAALVDHRPAVVFDVEQRAVGFRVNGRAAVAQAAVVTAHGAFDRTPVGGTL